jgi:hypothetical protein
METSESVGQTQVLRVIDGAGNHGDRVVVEGLTQHGQELVGRLDRVAAGSEAFGIGDEVRLHL